MTNVTFNWKQAPYKHMGTNSAPPAPKATLEITIKGGDTAKIHPEVYRAVANIGQRFIDFLGQGGSWVIQIKENMAVRSVELPEQSLRVVGSTRGSDRMTRLQIWTPKGVKDCLLNGPLYTATIMNTLSASSNRIFHLNGSSPGQPALKPSSPPLVPETKWKAPAEEFIALFLVETFGENPAVLVSTANEKASDHGGQNIIDYCIEQMLVEKDGKAAYSITEAGKDLIHSKFNKPVANDPPKSESTPPAPVQLSIAGIQAEITALKAVLAGKAAKEERVERLKLGRKKLETDRVALATAANKQEAEVARLNESIQRKKADAERLRTQENAKRAEILKAETSIRDAEDDLRKSLQAYVDAEAKLDEFREVLKGLAI